ncbi:MAG TPA: DOMON-like domain-containing protein [Zoogloea sp.]|nr:DOMON-like domain-containing protein [Zoogloea sp.]
MPLPPPLDLVCHPAAPDPCVRRIGVTVAREADGGLDVRYRLEGALDGLRLPAGGLPVERLWAHTCFELFVLAEGGEAYREFNFSPGGQWMCFDFSAYRARIDSPAMPAPQLDWQRSGDALTLALTLPASALPAGALRLGITAVVEHADGSHRYWALGHPPGKPDFHHRDGFALALPATTP